MEKNYRYHLVEGTGHAVVDERGYTIAKLPGQRSKAKRWLRYVSFLSHVTAWTLVVLLAYDSIRTRTWGFDRFRQHKGLPAQLTYSPAQDNIEYVVKVSVQGFEGRTDDVPAEFLGPPSDELDKAWSDLYNFGMSAISKQEASYLPNKTTPIPETDDKYLVELSVFHDLHCLNRLRKALNPFYFCPRSDPHCDDHRVMGVDYDSTEDIGPHLSHCLHLLRESIMCHSDISPIVWHKSDHIGLEGTYFNQGFLKVAHTCRNFDSIKQWAIDHQYKGSFDLTIPPEEDNIVIPILNQ